MSARYDLYLQEHKVNVLKGLEWIKENLPDILLDIPGVDYGHQIGYKHDESKSLPDEYVAYDAYYYGNNKSYEVVQKYNIAWLVHLHRNPHHWQHWVLINDDPKEGEKLLDIPYNYIIEMICDWWAFSWKAGNLKEIFKWYSERKDYIKLSNNTREIVDWILGLMEQKLEEL